MTVRESLQKKILACGIAIGAFLTSYVIYDNYTTMQQEYQQQCQQQQETIVKLQEQIDYLNTEIKILNNDVKYQKNILDKTYGRITNEHMNNSTQVSRGIREHYNIDTFKLLSRTNVTAAELNNALSDTNLEGLGEAFITAEIHTGINALFLAGLAKIESGNGTSALFHEKNNLFGFQAYDSSPYESGKGFNSKEECIYYVANFLKENYCSENGCYYRGGTIADVNYYYATNQQWGTKVFNAICELENKCI